MKESAIVMVPRRVRVTLPRTNFAGNFIEIGSVDVTQIESPLPCLNDSDWALDVPGRSSEVPNPDLQAIALVFDPDLRHSDPTRLPLLKTFEPALRPLLKQVADYYESSEAGKALMRSQNCPDSGGIFRD